MGYSAERLVKLKAFPTQKPTKAKVKWNCCIILSESGTNTLLSSYKPASEEKNIAADVYHVQWNSPNKIESPFQCPGFACDTSSSKRSGQCEDKMEGEIMRNMYLFCELGWEGKSLVQSHSASFMGKRI